MKINKYGVCSNCQSELEPIWFIEEEYRVDQGRQYKTGRTRTACSHLVCPVCLKSECVDDSFDGPWR